jgi:hypothetical protein
MVHLLCGAGLLTATAALFRACMPRDGKTRRWLGTVWEPYVGVILCAGFGMGAMLFVSGLFQLVAN